MLEVLLTFHSILYQVPVESDVVAVSTAVAPFLILIVPVEVSCTVARTTVVVSVSNIVIIAVLVPDGKVSHLKYPLR